MLDYSQESDELLMLSFKKGEEKAFETLVERYKDKIYNYINKYINNKERSEEIAQEVFIRLYRKQSSYKIKAKFSTFIYRIAFNLSYNEVRDRKRRKTDVKEDFSYIKDINTPDKIYEEKETEQILKNALESLPTKYKDVIILCDLENLTYKEAGKVLGLSMGTIQSRLSRGRMKLKQNLEKKISIKDL